MATAAQTVQDILDGTNEDYPVFIPTRYPNTYAYDFYRAHGGEFGEEPGDWSGNRGMASQRISDYCARTGQNRIDVLLVLADGYLAETRHRVTTQEKTDALVVQMANTWKSLGFTDAPAPEEARRLASDLLLVAALASGTR